MVPKVRILPLTIVIVGVSLGLHVGGLWPSGLDEGASLKMFQAYAQEVAGEEQLSNEENNTDKKILDNPQKGELEDPALDVSKERSSVLDEGPQFTTGEISMLQNLASRRQELDGREEELGFRENLIKVAEKRVEGKIQELKIVEARIESLLDRHDKQQEDKLQKLVKMYQTMKPVDAARIFETLDMDILIEVVKRMSERRMAPIMAAMESERAKAVTIQLATGKKLPEWGS